MKQINKIILPLVCFTALGTGVGMPMPQAGNCQVVYAAARQSTTASERRVSFNDGWRFHLGDAAGAEGAAYDDSTWRKLSLPHDWSIELPFDKKSPAGNGGGFLNGGIGWYRKTFTVPANETDRSVVIDFDGVYMNSEVWVNGHYLGKRPYGYSSFQYDVTKYLNAPGTPNQIAVKVNNNQPTSRWYSGSGIYRNVWLDKLAPVHVGQWGTYVTVPQINQLADGSHEALVDLSASIENSSSTDQKVTLRSTIYDKTQKKVSTQEMMQLIPAGGKCVFPQKAQIRDAALWSVETPDLYTLKTDVLVNGRVVDHYDTPFGVRSFKFDPNTGFSLNGKPMKLHGVCLHHDEGSLGSAFNKSAVKRELQIMKDMGVNAIRTSHNPPAPELLDMADRMGFLVMDEAFDCWETKKSDNDYHLYFNDWAERDVKTMVNRDKNHPSIVLWSIGNEIPNRTLKTAQKLKKWVEEVDATRPVTMANAGGNYDADVADVLGAVGYNYFEKAYDSDHKKHPGWAIFGSETSSAVRTRGVYHLPTNKNILEDKDLQCSNYDNSVVPWGKSAEQSWIDDRDRPFVAGQFIWTGFDYIGEPTPYGDNAKSSYFGITDTCGFPKDIYYFYKSQWTSKPLVHLLPDWNEWKQGDTVPVWAYTNADTVELFLNGKSLGRKNYDPAGKVLHLEWQVPYAPGELKAVAKDHLGRVVASDVVRPAGQAAAIRLTPDRREIAADGSDLVYITADVIDSNGTIVPDAAQPIDFAVEGGTIAGVDNGNPISFESYRGSSRQAFHGKCLLIVKADKAGTVKITAKTADGSLSGNSVNIKAKTARRDSRTR